MIHISNTFYRQSLHLVNTWQGEADLECKSHLNSHHPDTPIQLHGCIFNRAVGNPQKSKMPIAWREQRRVLSPWALLWPGNECLRAGVKVEHVIYPIHSKKVWAKIASVDLVPLHCKVGSIIRALKGFVFFKLRNVCKTWEAIESERNSMRRRWGC